MIIFIIGWIADSFYPDNKRGAEIEDYILIEEGIRRGHQIVRMKELSEDVDMYIVANCVDNYNTGELLAYLSQKPYINVEHDLRAPRYPFYPMFASNALINVYHSPFHEEYIRKLAGEFKHFLHPMCLEKEFADFGWERLPQNEVLYVGDYSMEKGYNELKHWIEQRSDHQIWHFGGGFEEIHPQMIEMGELPHSRMPGVYNTFSSVVFLPRYPQACSRIIAEAYLCKVPNIITNGKDGFTSYGWMMKNYDEVRVKLIKGHTIFWDRVESEIEIIR